MIGFEKTIATEGPPFFSCLIFTKLSGRSFLIFVVSLFPETLKLIIFLSRLTSFEKTIISDIESELVKPYRYENPNNIIADAIILKTKYLIAASLDKLFDLSKAINEYQILREKYPESSQVPFSLFMQGFIYANMLSNFEKARKHYEQFLNKFSNHELAQSVQFELKYLGIEIQEIPELKHLIK